MNFWNEQKLKEALGNIKTYNFPSEWSANGLIIWHENFVAGNMILARDKENTRGVPSNYLQKIVNDCSTIITNNPAEFFKYNKPIVEFSGNSGNIIINLARFIRKDFNGKVIGVTGSSGKSTTTKILYNIFSSKYKTDSNVKSKANTSWGIAWNMTGFDINSDYWILETSLGGGMSRNSAIVKPDYAIITNVAPVHLTGNMELKDIAEEKSRIFNSMKEGQTAILYNEMKHFDIVKKAAEFKGLKVITFGENADSDIRIIHGEENKFIISGVEYSLGTKPVGKHIMLDMAAALAVAKEENFSLDEAVEILRNFESLDGRGAEFDVVLFGEKTITIVDESYNANPLSMEASITSFGEKYADKNKVLILGDMAQCGTDSEKYHRELAICIDKIKPSKIFLCGEEIQALYAEIKDTYDVEHYNSVNALFKKFIKDVSDGDYVMIKASNSVNLHKIVSELKSEETI